MKSPAILASLRSADLARLQDEIAALEAAGIDGLHIDVMDGDFVAETCFDPEIVGRVRELTRALVDVHLIARDPALIASAYAEAGADRISFHLEVVVDPRAMIEQLRGLEVGVGLVVLPPTPIEQVFDWLDSVDLINPLGVDPTRGLGFQETTYARIEALVRERARRGRDALRIQADGGVWAKTRDELVRAGADELVGGYPIFSSEDYRVAVDALRNGI